jgi:hypothetical protein
MCASLSSSSSCAPQELEAELARTRDQAVIAVLAATRKLDVLQQQVVGMKPRQR